MKTREDSSMSMFTGKIPGDLLKKKRNVSVLKLSGFQLNRYTWLAANYTPIDFR